jgi:hypothetical protein
VTDVLYEFDFSTRAKLPFKLKLPTYEYSHGFPDVAPTYSVKILPAGGLNVIPEGEKLVDVIVTGLNDVLTSFSVIYVVAFSLVKSKGFILLFECKKTHNESGSLNVDNDVSIKVV